MITIKTSNPAWFLVDIGLFLRRLLNSIWREFCVLVLKPLDSHGTYEELCIFPENFSTLMIIGMHQ